MKTKFLSILASGLTVLTGLLTTASTAPGHKVQQPTPPAIGQAAVTAGVTMPLCAVGAVPLNFCQALIVWLETEGKISISIASHGEIAQWEGTFAIGPIDLPSGK